MFVCGSEITKDMSASRDFSVIWWKGNQYRTEISGKCQWRGNSWGRTLELARIRIYFNTKRYPSHLIIPGDSRQFLRNYFGISWSLGQGSAAMSECTLRRGPLLAGRVSDPLAAWGESTPLDRSLSSRAHATTRRNTNGKLSELIWLGQEFVLERAISLDSHHSSLLELKPTQRTNPLWTRLVCTRVLNFTRILL